MVEANRFLPGLLRIAVGELDEFLDQIGHLAQLLNRIPDQALPLVRRECLVELDQRWREQTRSLELIRIALWITGFPIELGSARAALRQLVAAWAEAFERERRAAGIDAADDLVGPVDALARRLAATRSKAPVAKVDTDASPAAARTEGDLSATSSRSRRACSGPPVNLYAPALLFHLVALHRKEPTAADLREHASALDPEQGNRELARLLPSELVAEFGPPEGPKR